MCFRLNPIYDSGLLVGIQLLFACVLVFGFNTELVAQVAADPWTTVCTTQPYSHIPAPYMTSPNPLTGLMNFSAHAHPPLPPLPGVGHDSRVLPPGTLQDSYSGADVRSSSIASLRLKAREQSAAMEFFSTYGHIK